MKKYRILWMAALYLLLTGCMGTMVTDEEYGEPDSRPTEPEMHGSAMKTGISLLTDISKSRDAGQAVWSVRLAALNLDGDGVIRACVLDGVDAVLTIDAAGMITGETERPLQTWRESGDERGTQAAALAEYAVGKTVEQLRGSEEGKARESLVEAIVRAAERAQESGAQAEDTLHLAILADHSGSVSAQKETPGIVRLNCTAAAVNRRGEIVTACRIDSVQADMAFDRSGTISTNTSQPVPSKGELGADYGMKRYGGAQAEWDEQTARFCRYVAGKTAEEILGLSDGEGKAVPADLATSVTIVITPFQRLIAMACGEAAE